MRSSPATQTPAAPTPAAQDPLPRAAFMLLLVASVVILGAALAFQLIGGLRPCELCLWQRYPYAVAIGLSGVGFGLARAGAPRDWLAILLLVLALTFAIGAGIAAFHVGVEQKWWTGTTACVGAGGAGSLDALREQVLAAPVARCDEPAWSLFGISMAGYNGFLSVALTLLSLRFACRLGGWLPKRPHERTER